MTDLTLDVSRTIKAPAARIFAAWLDPKMLAQFMCSGEGIRVGHVDTDPSVGGDFHIMILAGDKEVPHSGTYLEITPNTRLQFTWVSPYTVEGSVVTLTFDEFGDATKVMLNHRRFRSEDSRDGHANGWTNILAALDKALLA